MRESQIRALQTVMGGILLSAAMVAASATHVQAQGAVLSACFVPNSGVVYRVNPPTAPDQDENLKNECTGKKHVLFSWNSEGPQGPPGADGAPGTLVLQNESVNVLVPPGGLKRLEVFCPAGMKALGGGAKFDASQGVILHQGPFKNTGTLFHGWFALGRNTAQSGQGLFLTVEVICATSS